ncbi:MAG: DNA adenine methylase, partial [Bacteroidota bacterium]
ENALLNDINPHIIKFYKDLQSDIINPAIIKRFLWKEGEALKNAEEAGYEHYRYIKERFNLEHSSLDFLFLSRTAFNGMMRFNKKGEWNIPFCKKPERFSQSYITKIVNQTIAAKRKISDEWVFNNLPFEDIISQAGKNDFIYCDPPYFGRYVDYYNGWTAEDEERLFDLLDKTPAKFILSTWHHNDYRSNEMIVKFWNKFNMITKDHFYHSGGKIENRRTIVEALVCNFDITEDVLQHNHTDQVKIVQPSLF